MTNDRFERCSVNGTVIYRCSLIGTPHAFSTRLGGVSKTDFLASLNLEAHECDTAENVSENRRRFAAAAGLEGERISAHQIHGAKVIYAEHADDYMCDGFVTDRSGLVLTVKTADCVPILLWDRHGRAVAALHAGWRGTAAGVARSGVDAMRGLGVDPSDIVAAIGPAICKCCFEVGEEFPGQFCALSGLPTAERYIERDPASGRLHADIIAMNRDLLLQSGVPPESVCESGICTCCHTDEFFSHRASAGKRGLMNSAIMLTPH